MKGILVRGWSALFTQSLAIAAMTIFVWPFFVADGGMIVPYVIGAWVGLCVMLSGASTVRQTESVDEMADSHAVRLAISFVIFVYTNALFLVTILVGATFHVSGYSSAGVLATVLTPTLDFELSERGVPTVHWFAGRMIGLFLWIGELAGHIADTEKLTEALVEARDQIDSPSALVDAFTERVQLSASVWA